MTRRWALSLFAVARASSPKQKNRTKKVMFQDVTVDTIVVVVDDQLALTKHIQTDEKKESARLTR